MAHLESDAPLAGIYCRVPYRRDSDQTTVAGQEVIGRRHAASTGVTVANRHVFEEQGCESSNPGNPAPYQSSPLRLAVVPQNPLRPIKKSSSDLHRHSMVWSPDVAPARRGIPCPAHTRPRYCSVMALVRSEVERCGLQSTPV